MSDTTGPSMRAIVSRHTGPLTPGLAHQSATPAPPTNATVPSTTRSSRWVRLLRRARLYQGSRWYGSTRAPPRGARVGRAVEGAEAADRVHDERHAHAGAGALRQRLDELIGDTAGPEDVALHVDRLARRPDGVEHCWIERRAVGQDVDAIPRLERR